MGDLKTYRPSGGFDEYLYASPEPPINASNGIQAKVIVKKDSDGDHHDSLPMFSNTSEIYLKRDDDKGHSVEQARIYRNRRAALDLDWGHSHKEFEKGIVHVHEWHKDPDGKWVRGATPRYMTDAEIARYGELLRMANPQIKFRP